MACCGKMEVKPGKLATRSVRRPYLNDGRCPRCGADVVIRKSQSPTGSNIPFYKCLRGHVLS